MFETKLHHSVELGHVTKINVMGDHIGQKLTR
jgi:hypothetical protein